MRRLFSVLALVMASGTAFAADDAVYIDPGVEVAQTPITRSPSIISEFRLGGFGHSIDSGPENGSFDINAELLFAKPFVSNDPWIEALMPRPHVGGSFNTDGGTSMVYAGFTWTFDITPKFFVEGSFGASVNNGEAGNIVPAGRIEVGCNALFRESASLGFRLTENLSVMGTVEHASNAGLCDKNRGITNAGVRFGYKF
jgi:lipid A 3-O-deacylase